MNNNQTVPQPRADFIRNALMTKIETMLADLGNPPLVDRIFPNGWKDEPQPKLEQLYDLCVRTFAARAKP